MTRYDDLVELIEAHDGDGCLLWPHGTNGHRYGKGYGRLLADGRVMLAHRVALGLVEPEPDGGAHALHSCDVPACVNPAHLRWGSHAENMADRSARGRGNNVAGEAHGAAKLTEDEVREIRRLAAEGELTQAAIGELFGVAPSLVSQIHLRKKWAHLGDGA